MQATDVGGQLAHLPQALVHARQHGGDVAKALGQARLQRGVQLLVDGGAHLFELLGVVGLQRPELLLERGAHLADALLVALGEFRQALAEGLREQPLLLDAFGAALALLLGQVCPQVLQALAEALDPALLVGGEAVEVLAKLPAAGVLLFAQRSLDALAETGKGRVGTAAEQHPQQRSNAHQRQEDDDEQHGGEIHRSSLAAAVSRAATEDA